MSRQPNFELESEPSTSECIKHENFLSKFHQSIGMDYLVAALVVALRSSSRRVEVLEEDRHEG